MNDNRPSKQKRTAATTDYVDSSIDAQRQYSESLFVAAANRLHNSVTDTLTKALETIRPQDKLIKLPEANQKALSVLREQWAKDAAQFKRITGLSVESAQFNKILDLQAVKITFK